MAIWSCSRWSVASINSSSSSWTKSHKIPFPTPTTTCSNHIFLSLYDDHLKCSSSRPSSSSAAYCTSGTDELHLMRVRLLEDSLQHNHSAPDPPDDLNHLLRRALTAPPQSQELAYQLYQQAKQMPDFTPQKSTLSLLLRYLIRSKKWVWILALSDDCRKYNVLPDSLTSSRLVSSCVKAKKFRVLESWLETFKKSDPRIAVVAFRSALRESNQLNMYRTTLSLYDNMMKSADDHGFAMDSECYVQVMTAYHKVRNAERVEALFNEVSGAGRRVLHMNKANLNKICRIMCDSLGKSGRALQALEYFRDMMKRTGMGGDASIYSSLIRHLAASGQVAVAEELFEEAKEKKMLTRDPEMYLKLVLMYVEEGPLDKTLEIVKAMRCQKLRVSDCIFCTVVNGFSKKQGFGAGVRVYEELVSQGCEPGQVTYASVINAYFRMGLYPDAEKMFLEMEHKGFDKCVVAYSTIISMYGKTGRITDAMRLLEKMKLKGCPPNIWVYNSLLDMHGRAKDLSQVEKLWEEIKTRKLEPDQVSYTTVIGAYNKAMEYEGCVKLYHEYRQKGGAIDRAMAGLMVGVFSKTSQFGELLKLLRDMKSQGMKLDVRLYKSALNALRDAGLDKQVVWLNHSFEAT
ncbi:hypothetical protein Tsubulata_038700 [Turnera subulata]|uniref:Pentacotripeptide-repeat region of PRORP domain-containing protein n=1 Tax=Turnera subulata TaxID=218843 RepID=A0A9Q0F0F6_9ROSI|nr:hypothetical protein Tsubulata_038700 [Turnera subulata]